MENLGSLILFFAAGFAVALSTSWLIVKITFLLRRQPDPAVGTILRVRATSGVYRSHLVSLGESAWIMSAPLQRDHHVPLREGEEVIIEAADKHGALLFRSKTRP